MPIGIDKGKFLDPGNWASIAAAVGSFLVLIFIIISIIFMPAPYRPAMPNPNDGSVEVSPNINLSWIGGNPSNRIIYTAASLFGNNLNPELAYNIKIYNSNKSKILYEGVETGDSKKDKITHKPLIDLDQGTKYFWEITSDNNFGRKSNGPVWNFTTRDTNQIILDIENIYSNDEFAFAWDDTPDNIKRFKEFFGKWIDWLENANIHINSRVITVCDENNSLSLRLNDRKNIVLIEDKNISKLLGTNKLWAKNESNKLNIYYPLSTIDVTQLQDNSIIISYNLSKDGWIGIYSVPLRNELHNTKGIILNYEGSGSSNTFEVKLCYDDKNGTTYQLFGGDTKTNTTEWIMKPRKILYEDFKQGWNNKNDPYLDTIEKDKIRSVHIAFSDKPIYGDENGKEGRVKIYNIKGIAE